MSNYKNMSGGKMKYKFVILGAGPAGLTFANALKKAGEESFIVIEKEQSAGGLCRSVEVEGSPFDIGGGHFLDVTRKEANEFLFEFMPESEWNLFERNSQIFYKDSFISHPFEANIWQLPVDEQIKFLLSISQAGCNKNEKIPTEFIKWISWKLGDEIAREYMIPYNKKMFGEELDILGTYWLEKLPNVSMEETLRSCLERKAYGKQPGHAKFYYPKKYGYGELWRRLGDNIRGRIQYNNTVISIDFNERVVCCSDNSKISAEYLIVSIPWTSVSVIQGISEELKAGISNLKHTGVRTEYYDEDIKTKAHWIYYPEESYEFHRILVRSNFCRNSKGYWTETNMDRCSCKKRNFCYDNNYAYPLNTIDKPCIMKKLLEYGECKRIFGLGRWGEHEHYNSDVTVQRALRLANKILENTNAD